MKNTIICSAVESEISSLKGLENKGYLVRTIGIGLVDSAINLTRILEEYAYLKNIIFIGTAGAYKDSKLKIGDLVQAKETGLFSLSQYEGDSYLPNKMIKKISCNQFSGIEAVQVASVLEINRRGEKLAKVFWKTGYSAEHMELFSVARVAKKFNKNIYSVLGVSNIVNQSAHQDWLKNNKKVSLETNKKLKELLLNV